jgi:uncharacterized protein (DUF58 family)
MSRPRHDRELHRFNITIPREDMDWLRAIYGDQHVSETIRTLIMEHRKRVETQARAKAQLTRMNGQ